MKIQSFAMSWPIWLISREIVWSKPFEKNNYLELNVSTGCTTTLNAITPEIKDWKRSPDQFTIFENYVLEEVNRSIKRIGCGRPVFRGSAARPCWWGCEWNLLEFLFIILVSIFVTLVWSNKQKISYFRYWNNNSMKSSAEYLRGDQKSHDEISRGAGSGLLLVGNLLRMRIIGPQSTHVGQWSVLLWRFFSSLPLA